MHIISQHIPWTITIKKYSIIRCKDVIAAVHKELQEKMTLPEYFATPSEKRAIVDAVNERETDNPRSKRKWIEVKPKEAGKKPTKRAGDRYRVDYLDQLTSFKGLLHDASLIEERMGHDEEAQEDTWVMILGFSNEKLA